MAVPGSGQLSLLGIKNELDEDDYSAGESYSNVSLTNLSDGTDGTINTNNDAADRPDGSAPHTMSEFYSYNHTAASSNTSFSNTIADFDLQVNINTTGYSSLKTFTVNNPSGNLTHQFSLTNAYGTVGIAMSKTGDPGNSGTSNSGTGYVNQGSTCTLSGTGVWSANQTIYVRYRLIAHSGAAGDQCTSTFTNNGVSDAVEVNKISHNPGKSDIRLKTNIDRIGYSDMNIPIYLFNFKNDLNTTYKGVMAQDLLKMGFDDSVILDSDGYYSVDYNSIDVDMERV